MHLQRFGIKQEVEFEASQEIQFRTEVTGGSNVPVFFFCVPSPLASEKTCRLKGPNSRTLEIQRATKSQVY